jgi:cobalt-precorrin 5A hydrolase
MALGEAMIVAGVGCRRGAAAAEIEAAITAALARAHLPRSALGAVATSAAKRDEVGIAAAASALNVRLILVPQRELEAVGSRVVTRSQRVAALTGVPSVAEAAALAAAGAAAHLVTPRVVVGAATCALARAGGTP